MFNSVLSLTAPDIDISDLNFPSRQRSPEILLIVPHMNATSGTERGHFRAPLSARSTASCNRSSQFHPCRPAARNRANCSSRNLLRGDRTPAYVDRETGAAELRVSPDTWDQWVKEGRLPPPCGTFPSATPRWRWSWRDVDHKLSGEKASNTDAAVLGAANFGKKKGYRRDAA
jgi:hypothetical protein